MKKKSIVLIALLVLVAMLAVAGCGQKAATTPEGEKVEFNYMSVAEFKDIIDAGDLESGNVIAVSSQTEAEVKEFDINGEIVHTYARPLESDEDFAKLAPALDVVKASDAKVVILCPRGKSGATRPFEYFLENGVNADRLVILEEGVEAFAKAYPEYVTSQ